MKRHFSRRGVLAAAGLLVSLAAFPGFAYDDDGVTPFVVTPTVVVDRMIQLGQPRPGEYVMDLGSGDGRIIIESAKRGASGLGVDIDPRLVNLARENAKRAGVADRAQFEVRDLFETDLSKADLVTMYLLPDVNLKLRPRLISMLKPGTRIVSHDYDLGDWSPEETIELRTPDKTVGPVGKSKVMLWIVPADLRGRWTSDLPEHGGRWQFDIAQKHQMLEVKAFAGANEVILRSTGLRGHELIMLGPGTVGGRLWTHRFQGTLKGDRIEGEVRIYDGQRSSTLPWTATRTKS